MPGAPGTEAITPVRGASPDRRITVISHRPRHARPSSGLHRRWVRSLIITGAAAVLVIAVALVGGSGSSNVVVAGPTPSPSATISPSVPAAVSHSPSPAASLAATGATPTLASATPTASESSTNLPQGEARRDAEIAAVLASRAVAVTSDSQARWAQTAVSGADVPDFARLVALPIASWAYRVTSVVASSDPDVVVVTAAMSYRLDVDTVEDIVAERITMRQGRDGWLVVSEHTAGSRMMPWDLGTLTVIRGRQALVIGIDTAGATLREYAALTDRVAGEVTAFWGSDWVHRPVLVVPATTSQMARGLGRSTGSLTGLGAVTNDTNISARSGRGNERVWTNTPVMAGLSAAGRGIVLRHEMFHVAVGSASTNATPLWLEEGMAQYVGYLGSGVPITTAIGDVVADVRAGHLPTALPSDGQFSGSQFAIAYESAYVAADMLARQYGQVALIRFYRLVASGAGSSSTNVASALGVVTGQGLAAFTSAWRTQLQAFSA